MKKLVCKLVLFALVLAVSLPVVAAEGRKKGEREKGGGYQSVVAQMMRQLKKVTLKEEQSAAIKKLADEYTPKFAKVNEDLGPEVMKQMAEARKKAMAEGKKGKEAQQAVEAALPLTDVQKRALAERRELEGAFRKAVLAVLTPEQLKEAGLGLRTGGKRK